ncbi:MAG: 50S ribosomal protein L18 [Candidatus Lokiarchaeota archaeon]|nr:50S ribosomal protein L18 [Candidatus Lokiarchaeota archaeon]
MMAGPRYRVSMRRRREGKTNYQSRLKLVLSGKPRLVVRASIHSIIVQVVEARLKGDKVLVSAHSSQLVKYGWKYNSGNIPSAYLVGYLCGLRAKDKKIKECVLDLGILVHKHRVYAAFKGFLDGGIEVPHGDSVFKKLNLESRINGTHIKDYAILIQKKDKKKYEREFSAYLKNGLDPSKITEDFDKIKNSITKKL